MSNQADLNTTDESSLENKSITPSVEAVLIELGIESAAVKFTKPRWKRTHYQAVINWLTK
ncbi:MAG: hypothetical protein HC815_24920 [Richelia sp. RM1_1_1]|nr:hypothetical protein [Richelia sp. RM1_1_1]